jgi:2-oxoglutarate ferredoxin oxidoreductase subunit beta
LNYDPLRTVLVSGIGCSSRTSLYTSAFGMHAIHGRAIPVATGIRLSRPDIPVLVIGGDGDLFSIGTGHFVQAARNNLDITVFCLNNMMYAMTKNQSSPSSPAGHVGSFTPTGSQAAPLNLVEFAICCKSSFVARSTTFSPKHLGKTIRMAVEHKGFSFIDIITPCQTFNPGYFSSEEQVSIIDVNERYQFDTKNYSSALQYASQYTFPVSEFPGVLPVGIFFES